MTKEQKEEFLQYLENLKLLQTEEYMTEGFELAISALKGGWIPMTTRPMTEEEITSYDYYNYFFFIDEPRIMDCKLPDDGEEVEVTINGKVVVDTFYNDGNEGCYFDSVNIEDVTAWRRCEPYKKGE